MHVAVECAQRLIVVVDVGGHSRRFSTQLTANSIDEFRESFYEELETVWQILGNSLKPDLRLLAVAMRRLYDIGVRINFEVFANSRYEFEAFVRSAVPNWRMAGTAGYVPPIFTIKAAQNDLLPLEFVPVFDTTPPRELDTIHALAQVAARFPSFSMITQRILKDVAIPPAASAYIENTPRLNVGFFRHAGLGAVAADEEFFATSPDINLRGPWPATELATDVFKAELAEQVWNPPPSESGYDHVQHFSCHCHTEDESSKNYALLLAHARKWFSPDWYTKRATIADFEKFFGSAAYRTSPSPYPLIFLSACGSSRVTARGVTSFPALFLSIGNRGVIGTETAVPDKLASAFTRYFYNSFLRAHTLGECIYRARWRLLLDQYNPLGILYTAYADTDLRVRRPAREN